MIIMNQRMITLICSSNYNTLQECVHHSPLGAPAPMQSGFNIKPGRTHAFAAALHHSQPVHPWQVL